MSALRDPQLAAWRSISTLFRELTDALEDAVWSNYRLPLSWYEALDSIHRHGGALRMAQVADSRVTSRSATTRLIEKLEEAGLVERKICPTDRRGILVTLTELGEERRAVAESLVHGVLQERFGRHLSDDDAQRLLDSLTPAVRGTANASAGLDCA